MTVRPLATIIDATSNPLCKFFKRLTMIYKHLSWSHLASLWQAMLSFQSRASFNQEIRTCTWSCKAKVGPRLARLTKLIKMPEICGSIWFHLKPMLGIVTYLFIKITVCLGDHGGYMMMIMEKSAQHHFWEEELVIPFRFRSADPTIPHPPYSNCSPSLASIPHLYTIPPGNDITKCPSNRHSID